MSLRGRQIDTNNLKGSKSANLTDVSTAADWIKGARAEIYLGVGMFIAEFNAPESSAGTHVEHAAYLSLRLGDGRETEPIVEGQEEDVVLQICDALVT